MIGRVVSTKMKGTVTILTERVAMHPLYKKTYAQSKKYLVDDPVGVKDGDIVEIVKVRPISKNKHWKIVKVLGRNLAEIVESAQKEAAEAAIAEVMPEIGESDKIGESENQQVRKSDKSDKSEFGSQANRSSDLSGIPNSPKKRTAKKKEVK